MTPEDEQRALVEKARIAELRTNFEAYKEECRQQERQQEIGKLHDLKFDDAKDLHEQVNEKRQHVDLEFEADKDALEIQNFRDGKAFDDWMQGQREQLRAGDITHNPEKAQPRLVPGFDRGTGDPTYEPQFDKDFGRMETMRDAASEQIRQEFRAFQEGRHEARLDELTRYNDDNIDHLDAVESYLEPLPWESEQDAQDRARPAIESLQKAIEEDRNRPRTDDWTFKF